MLQKSVRSKVTHKITLIALIITIIVMLILVAVTINVALNGGIFNNAREAKEKTQRQADKEELIAHMVGAYTSSGNFATSNVGELPGWYNHGLTATNIKYDVTYKDGTDEFKYMYAENNIFYYLDGQKNEFDIYYFDDNTMKIYVQPSASTTNVSRESFVTNINNTPIKTYTR